MRACFIYNQASTFHCFCTILPTAPCRFHWLLFVSHTSMPATLGSLEVHPTNSKVSNFNFVFFQGIVVFQSLSRVWLFVTPWTAAHQVSWSFTISQSLLKLMSIESVMTSNHLILCCPLLLPSVLPMIFQDWFPLGWTSWISLQSKGLSGVFSNTPAQKHQLFDTQPSL